VFSNYRYPFYLIRYLGYPLTNFLSSILLTLYSALGFTGLISISGVGSTPSSTSSRREI
jgi:hypothetical protein